MPKIKRKTKKRTPRPNMLFPGHPAYQGPQRGWFAWVHHGKLFERATENIDNRVYYVKEQKPKNEISIRLSHIMYLGPYLSRKLTALARAHAEAVCRPVEYAERTLHDHHQARAMVMDYVTKHKPKNRWNGGTLTTADGNWMTG